MEETLYFLYVPVLEENKEMEDPSFDIKIKRLHIQCFSDNSGTPKLGPENFEKTFRL